MDFMRRYTFFISLCFLLLFRTAGAQILHGNDIERLVLGHGGLTYTQSFIYSKNQNKYNLQFEPAIEHGMVSLLVRDAWGYSQASNHFFLSVHPPKTRSGRKVEDGNSFIVSYVRRDKLNEAQEEFPLIRSIYTLQVLPRVLRLQKDQVHCEANWLIPGTLRISIRGSHSNFFYEISFEDAHEALRILRTRRRMCEDRIPGMD